MERLPYELRLNIFQLLSFNDKLTCLFVSKNWNRFVKSCVFSNVRIMRSEDLPNAIVYFKKNKEIAFSVINLEISYCRNVLLYMPHMQQLFTKLKKLELSSRSGFALDYPPKVTGNLGGWNNLEEFCNECEWLNRQHITTTVELILSKACPKLTKLSLNLRYGLPHSNLESRNDSFLHFLQNAPKLTELSIKTLCSSLYTLENIHKYAPSLDSLFLPDLDFVTLSGTVQLAKTVHLKHLKLHFVKKTRSIGDCIDYISNKYAGLLYFSVKTKGNYCTFVHGSPERRILPLFSRCPQLYHYNNMFIPFTFIIANEMDRCGIKLNSITLYIDEDTVSSQCIALRDSRQGRYINQLCLYIQGDNTRDDDEDEDDDEGEDNDEDAPIIERAVRTLENLPRLTHLDIQTGYKPLNTTQFIQFLNMMPQLLDITVHCIIALESLDGIDDIRTDLSLKSIEIHNLDFQSARSRRSITAIMKKLLPRCRNLEKFTINIGGELGVLKLDFRKNPKIKSIITTPEEYFKITFE